MRYTVLLQRSHESCIARNQNKNRGDCAKRRGSDSLERGAERHECASESHANEFDASDLFSVQKDAAHELNSRNAASDQPFEVFDGTVRSSWCRWGATCARRFSRTASFASTCFTSCFRSAYLRVTYCMSRLLTPSTVPLQSKQSFQLNAHFAKRKARVLHYRSPQWV